MLKQNFTPIEMPVGNKYGSDYFITKSYKVRRIIKLYSNLEFKNWLTLELNPEVLTFCEQPYKAEMLVNGKNKETVFDMWVSYKDGLDEFQEVKYLNQLTDPQNKDYKRCIEQVNFQKKWCKANDIHYIVRNEIDIEKGEFYMENLLHMSSCIKNYDHAYAKSYYDKIQSLISKKTYTLEKLHYDLASLLYFDEFLSVISFAYYDGILSLNLIDYPLDLNSVVKEYGK